jgi:hypothetical protein
MDDQVGHTVAWWYAQGREGSGEVRNSLPYCSTFATPRIGPPGPENRGSIAETPLKYDYLLGIVHIVGLIC